ncbi:MAG: hypothetical protein ACFCUT_17105 [Kiloniellaceae bacterium]
MRVFPPVLSFLVLLLTAGIAQGGTLAPPGPNPSWTEMQKFEWYLGYLSRAANTCGTYVESGVLHGLARMTPYGDIGLGVVTGDGFVGPVCGRINNEAKELVADAERIRAYLEATYNCTGEACYSQKLSDWQFHACADVLKAHLAGRAIEEEHLRAVTITSIRLSGATLDFQARVRLKSCQGSLYVDLKESCRIVQDYTRGDCEIAGVTRY